MTLRRLRVPFIFVFLALAGLALRLFYIQIFQGLTYLELAQKQFLKTVKAESYRGNIYDRNGHILATTVESQSVYICQKELNKSKEVCELLQSVLSLDPNDLRQKIAAEANTVWLKRKLSPAQVERISRERISGIGIVTEQKRHYPNGRLAAHVIGCVGIDNQGLSGIEKTFDQFLKGKPFEVSQLRDGKGRHILDREAQADSPSSNSIVLTIDRSLQYMAEKEIEFGVKENAAESGMVIIQDPKTGEILAMACYPAYDPNLLSEGNFPPHFTNASLQNPSVSKLFEPGSTFKIVAFSGALEEKKFTPRDAIQCEGGQWKIEDRTINDHEPSRLITFSEVLEKSSNIGSAKIGLRLGRDTFYRYIRAFGFGSKTWISLPGEAEGLCRHPKQWTPVSLPTIAFGQEISVSALQLVNAFSVIANDGLLMEPVIVKQINEVRGEKVISTNFSSHVIRRVISPDTARMMRDILTKAVERGTGQQVKIPGYSVAGKTGTAQKFDTKAKKYYEDKYLSSFCGFLPADAPQLVCLVVIDNAKKNYWGGLSAAPVFSRVMSRSVKMLAIPTNNPHSITLARYEKIH